MKRFVLTLLAACPFAMTIPQAAGQNRQAEEHKHLRLASPAGGAVTLTALNMERDLSSEQRAHVVQLRRSVEIRIPGKASGRYTVLHADQAAYHEDTGQIEASGNVRVDLDAEK